MLCSKPFHTFHHGTNRSLSMPSGVNVMLFLWLGRSDGNWSMWCWLWNEQELAMVMLSWALPLHLMEQLKSWFKRKDHNCRWWGKSFIAFRTLHGALVVVCSKTLCLKESYYQIELGTFLVFKLPDIIKNAISFGSKIHSSCIKCDQTISANW